MQRWGGGLPQYAVGHLDRVARIRADVARVPGLALAGAAYDGVGIPAVIASGHRAATEVTPAETLPRCPWETGHRARHAPFVATEHDLRRKQ